MWLITLCQFSKNSYDGFVTPTFEHDVNIDSQCSQVIVVIVDCTKQVEIVNSIVITSRRPIYPSHGKSLGVD